MRRAANASRVSSCASLSLGVDTGSGMRTLQITSVREKDPDRIMEKTSRCVRHQPWKLEPFCGRFNQLCDNAHTLPWTVDEVQSAETCFVPVTRLHLFITSCAPLTSLGSWRHRASTEADLSKMFDAKNMRCVADARYFRSLLLEVTLLFRGQVRGSAVGQAW